MIKRKIEICRAIAAVLLGAAVVFSSPVAYLPEAAEVYASDMRADEKGFVIEDGVLKKYTGTETEVVIPEEVTEIGNFAFEDCSTLTNIVIPEGVTKIGIRAFSNCTALNSIIIPASVTEIRQEAFSGCNGIDSMVVDNENKKYDSRNNCNAVIETSSNRLIAGCCKTIIPENVTEIGSYAFSDYSTLTSISIPEGITRIGFSAFSGCNALTSITIPASVVYIEFEAFSDCSSVTSIVVKSGNTHYDSRNNCNAIIETCYNRLITGCCRTVIPESVTEIGGLAFGGCNALTSIDIPSSVTIIGASAFEGCSALTDIDIPSSITIIGASAFEGCSALTSVNIPISVTNIGVAVFKNCNCLTSITVDSGNMKYDNRNNCNAIIETSSNSLIAGCCKTVIPESVVEIGSYAFADCSALTSINIPENVNEIGYFAFRDCSALTSIDIPEGVSLIKDYVFAGCKALTHIGIPESVTVIRAYAFDGCSALTSIDIPESVMEIRELAFSGCGKLVIYGEKDSYAQTYAEENQIPFRLNNARDILSSEKIEQLLEENKTQDTVIETENGVTFAFAKGSIEAADGVFYDFGTEFTEDYASLPNQNFTEEEFAFRIDYYHSGALPGEAEITIPAGEKWAGKKLYYYEIMADGTYKYVCRSTVASGGKYTIKQSHCSSYAATTKVPENLGDVDGKRGVTIDDALAVLKYVAKIPQDGLFLELGDVDGKDGITIDDALVILKYVAKINDRFE